MTDAGPNNEPANAAVPPAGQAEPEDSEGFSLETVKATLECAQADIAEETDRMKVLDHKLTSIAAFSGIALSVGSGIGSSTVVSGALSLGFTIALGAVLSVAVIFLLLGAVVALRGLSPKGFEGISLQAFDERLNKSRMRMEPSDAIARMAATYRPHLKQARDSNGAKVDSVRWAYQLVGTGLGLLATGLVLAAVGAVV